MIKSWKNILILPNASILDTIQALDNSGLRIVIIADKEQNLLGTVTDGDIRKAIINKVSLDSPIFSIMNSSPFHVDKNEPKAIVIEKMQRNNILAMPVLDDKKIVDLEILIAPDKIKNYENVVFIMAGGFGKRLNPLTLDCPKPMLKLNGKPILETTINNFKSYGFNNFIISTHFLPEVIKEYFKDGSSFNVCIDYVDEIDPLGTGGALGLLPDSMINKPIIMINGDVLTNLDYGKLLEYHHSNNSAATVVVRDYEHQVPYGVIESENLIIKDIVEKPSYKYFVNAGIYVLNPEIYRLVKNQEKIDMPDLLKRYIDLENDISIYPLHEYWADIGSPDDFNKAKSDIDLSIKKSNT
jgi:dTDP-glucose pyrophosphorylase/CBS domain-containing protein